MSVKLLMRSTRNIDHARRLLFALTVLLVFFSVLLFPVRGWCQDRSALAEEAPEVVSQKVTAQIRNLSDPDPRIRQQAAENLKELGVKARSAAIPLLQRLHDRNADVRFYAANTLAYIDAPAKICVPALLHAMDDRDADVSMQATLSLTAFPEAAERIVPKMLAGLSSQDKHHRYYCLASIGYFGKAAHAAVPLLIQILTQTPNGLGLDNRLHAIKALKQIGIYNPAVETALLIVLKEEAEWLTTDAAAEALGEIGTASPAVLTGLAETFTPVPIAASGTRAAISFALLSKRSLAKIVLWSKPEREKVLRQCEAASMKLRNNKNLFGDASRTTEPALTQLESITRMLAALP